MRRRVVPSFAIALALTLGTISASGGVPAAPHVTDGAGDANFVNGQGRTAGYEQGPDARPASMDGADLRAAWFETAYDTVKVLDPATGRILRVEHRPTALIVRIRTQGLVHPTVPPGRDLFLEVMANVRDCRATFQLWARGSGPANDTASILAASTGCGGRQPGSGVGSPVKPAYQGTEVTLTFPLDRPDLQAFIANGMSIRQPAGRSVLIAPFVSPLIDETVAGSDFVIGQDVPPDIDCATDPEDPACQA